MEKFEYDEDPMRVIPTSRLVELITAENKLLALEDAGVREWEGYTHAIIRYVSIEGYSNGIWSLLPEDVWDNLQELEHAFPIAYMIDIDDYDEEDGDYY